MKQSFAMQFFCICLLKHMQKNCHQNGSKKCGPDLDNDLQKRFEGKVTWKGFWKHNWSIDYVLVNQQENKISKKKFNSTFKKNVLKKNIYLEFVWNVSSKNIFQLWILNIKKNVFFF